MNTVFYYRLLKAHQEFTESELPVNLWQLMRFIELKTPTKQYFTNKYITFLKLSDINQVGNKPAQVDVNAITRYNWTKLLHSVEQDGIRQPIIAEQRFVEHQKQIIKTYIALEGKHRIAVASMIKPYNPDFIIPCILVEQDSDYTNFMQHKVHPNPMHACGWSIKGDIMFYNKELELFQKFLQNLLSSPLPMDKQHSVRKDDKMWCDDWWSIEILKFFINGEQAYIGDPPPNRLKNNDLWEKNTIIRQSKEKLFMLENLKQVANEADNILIFNCCRGIDVGLVSLVKSWANIECCDENKAMGDATVNYFKLRLGLPVSFTQSSIDTYNFATIDKPTIVIVHFREKSDFNDNLVLQNNNIVKFIRNGQVIERNK